MDLSDLRDLPQTLFFSRRERQILQAICYRQSNKQIAADLGVTTGTVKNSITVLLRRMEGLQDRGDLLLWCLQHPEDLKRGYTRDRGLHVDGCECGSPGCSFAELIAA